MIIIRGNRYDKYPNLGITQYHTVFHKYVQLFVSKSITVFRIILMIIFMMNAMSGILRVNFFVEPFFFCSLDHLSDLLIQVLLTFCLTHV